MFHNHHGNGDGGNSGGPKYKGLLAMLWSDVGDEIMKHEQYVVYRDDRKLIPAFIFAEPQGIQ